MVTRPHVSGRLPVNGSARRCPGDQERLARRLRNLAKASLHSANRSG